jgi:peroxiredoxin
MKPTGTTESAQTPRTGSDKLVAARPYVVSVGIVLLLASISLNVALALRVRSFVRFQSTRAAERLVKVGTAVPPIAAKRLDGHQEVLSYDKTGQPTVLYVFTPTCIWCARNLNNLKALMDKHGAEYRFIGLSLSEEGVAQYVARNSLGVPVYSGLSPETLKTYKLGSTPQTIVISPEGKVLQDWVGAYAGPQKSEVEAFFHITLPGLIPASEPKSPVAGGK